jgi:DNA polymerase III gamma/tau subunit
MVYSILISSKNTEDGLGFAKKICKDNDIDNFDITLLEPEKATGIEDVRMLQEKIILKPLMGKQKAVILNAGKGISQEAQNALLKALEEPPANTFIILIVLNKDAVLPTILSRCKVFDLNNQIIVSEEKIKGFEDEFTKLLNNSLSERLKLAENLAKDKDSTLDWLGKIILGGRAKMINPETDEKNRQDYQRIITILQKRYIELKNSNANLRLGLEELFINL